MRIGELIARCVVVIGGRAKKEGDSTERDISQIPNHHHHHQFIYFIIYHSVSFLFVSVCLYYSLFGIYAIICYFSFSFTIEL